MCILPSAFRQSGHGPLSLWLLHMSNTIQDRLPSSTSMNVDLEDHYSFPTHIAATHLRSDIVWWNDKTLTLVELTVCFDSWCSPPQCQSSPVEEAFFQLMSLCHQPDQNLIHVLNNCKVALDLRWYDQHNRVLQAIGGFAFRTNLNTCCGSDWDGSSLGSAISDLRFSSAMNLTVGSVDVSSWQCLDTWRRWLSEEGGRQV